MPIPTATASDAARSSCTSRRDSSPVTQRAPGHGDAAVERDRRLVGHERAAERDPGAPGLVLAPRLEAVGELDLDAGRARAARGRRAASGFGSSDPATTRATPAASDRVDARRRRAVVGARLHRHVERRAAGALAGGLERDDLAVPAAVRLGRALADDLAVRDDDGADGRLRIGPCRAPRSASSSARSRLMRSACTSRR